jgi:hypothetical protein
MFVPRVVNMRMIDDDIFVRQKGNLNMDLETDAMAMLIARRNNGYATRPSRRRLTGLGLCLPLRR